VTRRSSGGGARRAALLALAGAATARLGLAGAAALDARPAGAPWRRTNYAGRPVTLLGGPALALAATASAVAGAPAGTRAAAALVGGVSGLVGGYDDLAGARPEQARDKGLAGHLRALRAGRVSAGAVKVAGIGAAAAGLGGPPGPLVAGPLGASLAVLPADLGERVMLGDCGANAVGALLGLRLAAVPGRPARAGALAVVVGLTLASERVSFTRVIEATPVLRDLDRLGRRRGA
jgi:hypothetical protein